MIVLIGHATAPPLCSPGPPFGAPPGPLFHRHMRSLCCCAPIPRFCFLTPGLIFPPLLDLFDGSPFSLFSPRPFFQITNTSLTLSPGHFFFQMPNSPCWKNYFFHSFVSRGKPLLLQACKWLGEPPPAFFFRRGPFRILFPFPPF